MPTGLAPPSRLGSTPLWDLYPWAIADSLGDATRVLTGIHDAEFQIRQRLVEFYLCNLDYEWDLVPNQETVTSRFLLAPPLSILCLELC